MSLCSDCSAIPANAGACSSIAGELFSSFVWSLRCALDCCRSLRDCSFCRSEKLVFSFKIHSITYERRIGSIYSQSTGRCIVVPADELSSPRYFNRLGSSIVARCLLSWMWSQTNCSPSHLAWRCASKLSCNGIRCVILNSVPQSTHTTVVITVQFGGVAMLLRMRRAVPLEAGAKFAGLTIFRDQRLGASGDRPLAAPR